MSFFVVLAYPPSDAPGDIYWITEDGRASRSLDKAQCYLPEQLPAAPSEDFVAVPIDIARALSEPAVPNNKRNRAILNAARLHGGTT